MPMVRRLARRLRGRTERTERALDAEPAARIARDRPGARPRRGAEERGYIEPAELEAFALEHDLNDDEVEELTRELERIGLEVGAAAAAAPRPRQAKEKPPSRGRAARPTARRRAPPTACSSSSPTSAATSC